MIPFVESSSYPARGGNSVRPLIDGVPAFRRICEAIDAATHSVWASVTFMWPDFEMPDGRGTALDVLSRAAARGVDVRIIFWRPDEDMTGHRRTAFWGRSDHTTLLSERGSGIKVRWDRAHPGFCQHQKSWLIDADAECETAFVGGINLNPHSVVDPGHAGEGHNHDVYVELRGPATVDVHHNFVQRWNEASGRRERDGMWGLGSDSDLAFPSRIPAERGKVIVQVQRTIHAGRYADGRASPGGRTFDVASGEQSILDQYCAAIDAARSSIYLENQCIEVDAVIERLGGALTRGVEVVALVPAVPDRPLASAARAALARYDNFTLAGIAGLGSDGERKPVYVHDKLMLVDDEWATVGSCNLHRYSLYGNSELNVAFSDATTVRALRSALFLEHTARDTSHMDGRSALRLFRAVALANLRRSEVNDCAWQGLAFALDVERYGH